MAAVASGSCRHRVEAPVSLAGSADTLPVEVRRTASFALARITRREWVADGLMQSIGTGRGVSIYVFDGGVDPDHPEVSGRVRKGYDAFPQVPRICNGHGLAVAGAAAGKTLGLATEAAIVDVKVIDCYTMRGNVQAMVAASRWVIADHRSRPGELAIANWSLSIDTTRRVPAIDAVIDAMAKAGILVIASAGNYEMDACRISPANSRPSIVVGASRIAADGDGGWRDVRLSGTAYGRCVDLYAPGDSVPLPGNDARGSVVMGWRGTSMSAGYVSGAAAVLMQLQGSPAGIVNLLLGMATRSAVDEVPAPPSRRSTTPDRRSLLYIGPP